MKHFHWIVAQLGLQNEASAYFSGLALLVFLLALGFFILPPARKSKIRLPALALLLHLGCMTARLGIPEGMPLRDGFALTALFLLLFALARAGFLVLHRLLTLRHKGPPGPKIFADIVQAIIYAGVGLITLSAAGVEPSSLLTTSALLTAVVGLSLQETLGNLFSGLAIQAQSPFEVGDWIQFDDHPENVGMVVEINWRAARVLTLDQVEVTVPNSQLAKVPIRNFTKPLRAVRRVITAYAPYRVPPRRVERYVRAAISDVHGVLESPAPSVIPRDFDERGIRYDVRYYIDDFLERETIDADVRERIWYALTRAGIEIPVPQRFIELHEASRGERAELEEQHILERMAHLRKVDFLGAVPAQALRTLAERSETRLYDANEAIVRQGDSDDGEFFIVLRGEVSVRALVLGREQEVTHLGPGQFFGEMSLMTGEARKATVRSDGESELLVLDRDAFHHVFDERPELVRRISDVLARRREQLGEIEIDVDRLSDGSSRRAAGEELLHRIRAFFSL